MFDLSIMNSEKSAEDGAILHLKHPITGAELFADKAEKKPITIKLKGVDCDAYLKYQQKQLNKRGKGKNADSVDFAKSIRESAEIYADMTIGWIGIEEKGKPLEFNKNNAIHVYLTYKEIRLQVKEFIEDKENFIKG